MTIRDNKENNGVLLYSYNSTIRGWGVLLSSGLCVGIWLELLQGQVYRLGMFELALTVARGG